MACSPRKRHRADFSLLPMRLRCSALARSLRAQDVAVVVALTGTPRRRSRPQKAAALFSLFSGLLACRRREEGKKRCISYTHSEHEVIPERGFCSAWSLWVTRHTALMTAVKPLWNAACLRRRSGDLAEREVPLCTGKELLHVCGHLISRFVTFRWPVQLKKWGDFNSYSYFNGFFICVTHCFEKKCIVN